MRRHNRCFIIVGLTLAFISCFEMNALAFRGNHSGDGAYGGARGYSRGFSHSGFQGGRGFQHNQNVQSFHPNTMTNSNVNHADFINSHNQHVQQFSHQNLSMTPHAGVSGSNWNHGNNWNNNNNNWNHGNNWNGNNWNNWHNNWNNNWYGWGNGNNGWGWNNGWFFGAVLGVSLGAVLFTSAWDYPPYPYYGYYYPYYAYPDQYYYYPDDYYFPNQQTVTYNNNPPVTPAPSSPPNETWVAASNGDVPANAVVNTNDNGKLTYYCRATYLKKTDDGVLVPKDGCYIENQTVTMRFTSYSVLTTK